MRNDLSDFVYGHALGRIIDLEYGSLVSDDVRGEVDRVVGRTAVFIHTGTAIDEIAREAHLLLVNEAPT